MAVAMVNGIWIVTGHSTELVQNAAVTADQTLTLPEVTTDTLVSRESVDALKHKSISGADNTLTNLPNSALTYSQMSIGGNTVALGGSVSKDQITGVSSNGLIKRTGTNTYAAAVAGTDYAPATGILGTAFASVASTAIGSTGASDGANTWAKLASFTSATNNWAHDAYFLIVTDQFAVNSGASGMLALKLRNVGSASNATLAVTALTDSTPLSPENFRITYGALGDPYELWVKKNLTYGRVILYLLGNAGGGWTITWGASAAWQSTTPTGSVGQTDSALSVLPPKPRVGTVASSATPAINTNNVDQFNITALAAAITSMTTNLSGTPSDGQTLRIRIKDNGTGRAITWGSSFAGNLLTTTVAGKTHVQQLVYDGTAAKWVGTYVDTAGY